MYTYSTCIYVHVLLYNTLTLVYLHVCIYIPYSGKIGRALISANFKFGETNVCTLRDNAMLNIGEVLIGDFSQNRQIKTLAKFSRYTLVCLYACNCSIYYTYMYIRWCINTYIVCLYTCTCM